MQAVVQVFFGSQSGTAECFSEELKDEAEAQGISMEVIDLQKFTPETFTACRIVVLVVSTYGDGEPSDNAVAFHSWASDPAFNGVLKGQRFCVMGLGDMNYSRFNNMGLLTDLNLERLGAARIYQRGIGDDSQDIAADFKAWKDGGLWASLKKAIGEVQREGGFAAAPVISAAPGAAVEKKAPKVECSIFFGHEENDGAAKDVSEDLATRLCEKGFIVLGTHSLSDRKAVEIVRKLPKRGVAIVVVDVGPDGMCGPGRKLVRNMSIELDANSLAEKNQQFAVLTLATSKCNTSANALKQANTSASDPMRTAFDRAGLGLLKDIAPAYIDAGVDDVPPLVDKFSESVANACKSVAQEAPCAPEAAAEAEAPGAAPKSNVLILCSGPEAKEAGDALKAVWPGAEPSVDETSLAALAAASQRRERIVLVVECGSDGNLTDASAGFAVQLRAAPMAIKAQLRVLRYSLVALAVTEYGNAGERASANASRAEFTQAVAPVKQMLTGFGATCIAEASVDLQDASSESLAELCGSFDKGFAAGASAAPAARNGAVAPVGGGAFGTPALKMAEAASGLPAEVPGEASDVLARFYFEAERAKVVKVRQLRQCPNADEGLSTAEVEIEATGSLKGYMLGGTLSLLPENDPADVAAMLPFFGLQQADLKKVMTFVAAEGSAGTKVKRPFPTPCTVGEALSRYCDLGRAPTKKMLSALLPALQDQAARERVSKVAEDAGVFELLRAAPACCRMHEFWSMLGVARIDLCAFLLHCPRQKAREFTIASSPKGSPDRITLCVSLTSHEVPDLEPLARRLETVGALPADGSQAVAGSRGRFFGVASRWITGRLKAGDVVFAKQRPSAFHLPEKDVPVMMIGAGAGVAPFRGFWEELRRGAQTAPASLFFGCRHPEKDWLYKEEMSGAVKLAATGCAALQRVQVGPKRPLACLFTAFSRPGEGKQGQYVQDQVRAQSRAVKHWIENMTGAVFICGSTAMGTAVLEAIGEVLEGGASKVDELRKEGRIVAEMWG